MRNFYVAIHEEELDKTTFRRCSAENEGIGCDLTEGHIEMHRAIKVTHMWSVNDLTGEANNLHGFSPSHKRCRTDVCFNPADYHNCPGKMDAFVK